MNNHTLIYLLWFFVSFCWIWYHARSRKPPFCENEYGTSMLLYGLLMVLDIIVGYINYHKHLLIVPFVIIINTVLITCNRIMCEPYENKGLRYLWDTLIFMKMSFITFFVIS